MKSTLPFPLVYLCNAITQDNTAVFSGGSSQTCYQLQEVLRHNCELYVILYGL